MLRISSPKAALRSDTRRRRHLADFGMSPYRRVRRDSRRSSLGQATRSWAEIAACRPSTRNCPLSGCVCSPIADIRQIGDISRMTPGSAFNWIIATVMLATTFFTALAGRVTLRGGCIIDRDVEPVRFWMFVAACGIAAGGLFAQAVLHFR